MSEPDLSAILADLAAGSIDSAEAARRIEALRAREGATASHDHDEPAGPTGVKGTERVAIRAVGRRVTVIGDASVATASVTGEHVLRRQGEVLEVAADGELGPSWRGSACSTRPRAWTTCAASPWRAASPSGSTPRSKSTSS